MSRAFWPENHCGKPNAQSQIVFQTSSNMSKGSISSGRNNPTMASSQTPPSKLGMTPRALGSWLMSVGTIISPRPSTRRR